MKYFFSLLIVSLISVFFNIDTTYASSCNQIFLYNECIQCNTSQPVFIDTCSGGYIIGNHQQDAACSSWCQNNTTGSSNSTSNGGSCPVNSACCSNNLQRCSADGLDSSCPANFQWCYAGYCVNNDYNPSFDVCPISTSTTTEPAPASSSKFAASSPLGCPVAGNISTPYGYNIVGYSGFDLGCGGLRACHNGIDIGARSGSSITSVIDGIVDIATADYSKGNYISISNPESGVTITYEHMQHPALFKTGDYVAKDSVVGYVGMTGANLTGPHLHYKIELASSLLNPFRFVSVVNIDPILMMGSDNLSDNNYSFRYPIGAGHDADHWGDCVK